MGGSATAESDDIAWGQVNMPISDGDVPPPVLRFGGASEVGTMAALLFFPTVAMSIGPFEPP